MFNVFKGYKVVADATFCAYFLKKRNHYDKFGYLSMDRLMTFTEKIFKALKVDGVWTTPTPDEKRIIALTAQFQDMVESAATVKGDMLAQVPLMVDG